MTTTNRLSTDEILELMSATLIKRVMGTEGFYRDLKNVYDVASAKYFYPFVKITSVSTSLNNVMFDIKPKGSIDTELKARLEEIYELEKIPVMIAHKLDMTSDKYKYILFEV